MASHPAATVALRYHVRPESDAWELPEVPVPESRLHDLILDYLKALLVAWTRRAPGQWIVARNLAVRWIESQPKVGVDPDLCVFSTPPEADALTSLRLWENGHRPPVLAVEVVSANHPYKDYAAIQDKYAACGAAELWVFDPLLAGPRHHGGPFALQVWRRDGDGSLSRLYAGDGPTRSEAVDAWLRVVDVDGSRKLVISEDREGSRPWRTALEAALAELEALKDKTR